MCQKTCCVLWVWDLVFFMFIGYFLYLYFKCYLLSCSPLWPNSIPFPLPLFLWGCSHTHPPTPDFLSWHSPTLGHQVFTGPRASPPTDVWQGHPLLHIQLEPQNPPCVLFGWWFSLWELWGCWLVNTVVPPMRLQTPSSPQSFPNSSIGVPVLSLPSSWASCGLWIVSWVFWGLG